MYNVRGTEMQDFLRCRLAWKYRWIDGLQPKKGNNKLVFGTMFHKFLEVWYSTGDFNKARTDMDECLVDAELDQLEWDEILSLSDHVTGNYYKQYKDDLNSWEVIATELTFQIPLDDEIGYTGTIDLIVRDKSDGRIWFLDHKTTKSIESYDKNSDMDRQISRYWWALQQLFKGNGEYSYDKETWYSAKNFALALDNTEIGGFIYNLILKDYPVPPKVLKNGSLSKDKSQHTTYDMYCKALLDMDIKTYQQACKLGYGEILDHLNENPREYFRRIRVTRTQSEIDASIEELYATAVDMYWVKEQVANDIPRRTYRNITKDCPWCPFQPICQASMDGSNVDYLTESLYTKE